MCLLKFPVKILALLLAIILGTVGVLCKFASGLSNAVIGLFMFLVFLCGVITAFEGNWPMVGVLFVVEVICFASAMAVTVLSELVAGLTSGLMDFIRS